MQTSQKYPNIVPIEKYSDIKEGVQYYGKLVLPAEEDLKESIHIIDIHKPIDLFDTTDKDFVHYGVYTSDEEEWGLSYKRDYYSWGEFESVWKLEF